MSSKSIKRLYVYLAVTILCGIFSFVYEKYSHDVYSNYMVYLFAIPLLLGVIPYAIFTLNPRLMVRGWQGTIHAFAIATLTIGSILQGMLEIYGTSSPFVPYYGFIGGFLLFSSLILYAAGRFKPSLNNI